MIPLWPDRSASQPDHPSLTPCSVDGKGRLIAQKAASCGLARMRAAEPATHVSISRGRIELPSARATIAVAAIATAMLASGARAEISEDACKIGVLTDMNPPRP